MVIVYVVIRAVSTIHHKDPIVVMVTYRTWRELGKKVREFLHQTYETNFHRCTTNSLFCLNSLFVQMETTISYDDVHEA